MTIRHGKNVVVYFNGYDIGGDVNAISGKSENDLVTYAVFDGSNGYHHYPGLAKDEIGLEALHNDDSVTYLTATAQLEALRQVTPTVLTPGYQAMVLYGQTAGDPASVSKECLLKSYTIKSVVTDVNRLSAMLVSNDMPFQDSKVLLGKATKTTSGSGTALDNLASSSNGGVGYVQVLSCLYGTSAALIIEHSTDNSNWGALLTLGTFTTVGTACVACTGTVDEYIRATWTLSAGSPSNSATFAITFKRY